MSDLWDGVEKPASETKDKLRIFFNGFLDSDMCPKCGETMSETVKRYQGTLYDALECECGYAETVDLHTPTYDVTVYSKR